MSNITKEVYLSLLPPGPIWEPKEGGDFDLFLEALGENMQDVIDFLESISNIRSPLETPILSDLEKEFGFAPGSQITEETRRSRLNARKYQQNNNGSAYQMQTALNDAGFTDVFVTQNSPAIDPETYSGTLLVNNLADGQDAVKYSMPASQYWPMVFFVSGTVTKDGSGNITNIDPVDISIERIDEFRSTIMRNKPLHSWAYLVINLVQAEELDFGVDLTPDTNGLSDLNNPDIGGTLVSI